MCRQRLTAGGAPKVVWVREPIPNVYWWSSGQAQEDPARHAEIYAAMDAAAESGGGRVVVVDLPAWLREQGLDTDQDARPDGVHWSPEASLRIADEYLGEQLIRAALAPIDTDVDAVARDHRLHRRRLLGEPWSRRLGVGCGARRRADAFGWRADYHQPADGDARRARGATDARRRAVSGSGSSPTRPTS